MKVGTQRIWNTPFTRTFNVRLPIVLPPMAGVSGGLLAAEVTRAGGLGMIAAGHFQDVSKLETEIDIFLENTKNNTNNMQKMKQEEQHPSELNNNNNLAIGFIGFSSLSTSTGWANYEHILRTYTPGAVQFFAPSISTRQEDGKSNVQLAHEYGTKFIAQVGTIDDVNEVMQHGVDAIICQGREAGGHGIRPELGNSTMALASQASNMTDIPILAAGGIVNGKHLASALCVCDGVSIGTRYWASDESLGNKKLQLGLASANTTCDDVIRTTVFDQIQNELSTNKWPHPYNSVGVLRNQTTDEWEGKSTDELQFAIDNTNLLEEYKVSQERFNEKIIPTYAGEGVGEIDSIDSAYDITLRIEEEAICTMEKLLKSIVS